MSQDTGSKKYRKPAIRQFHAQECSAPTLAKKGFYDLFDKRSGGFSGTVHRSELPKQCQIDLGFVPRPKVLKTYEEELSR